MFEQKKKTSLISFFLSHRLAAKTCHKYMENHVMQSSVFRERVPVFNNGIYIRPKPSCVMLCKSLCSYDNSWTEKGSLLSGPLCAFLFI